MDSRKRVDGKGRDIGLMPDILEYVRVLSLSGRTLDIGSLNVNGCVRDYFNDYIGLDMRSGANVDIIGNGHNIPFRDKCFDNVTNLESMEHDDKFWETASEMYRVCANGGHVVVTAPTIGFAKHDYPSDYWRFLPEGISALMEGIGFKMVSCHMNETTIFYHGLKPHEG